MAEKIIIDNPRVIYSLAMILVLFEVRNLILNIQDDFIYLFKLFIFLLTFGQIIYLLVLGVALADVKEEVKEGILKASNSIYNLMLQMSVIFLFYMLPFLVMVTAFNSLGIPKTLPFKLLLFLISLILIGICVYSWNRVFIINETKIPILIVIVMSVLLTFNFVMHKL